jgi:hypothetical protein
MDPQVERMSATEKGYGADLMVSAQRCAFDVITSLSF